MAANGCYGRTCLGRLVLENRLKDQTLDTFLDQWYKGMFLSLKTDGRTQESASPKVETESWSGGCWTLNTLESPNDAVESSLYSILEHGGGYPPVLFESESLSGDFEKGGRKRQDPSKDSEGDFGEDDFCVERVGV